MSSLSFLFIGMCLVLSIYQVHGQNKCSIADDKYFDVIKNKCKDCPSCPIGRGRIFDNARNDPDTNKPTECLPCIRCSTGTFNDRNGLTNECRKCTHNKCSNFNRQIQKNCTAKADYECGHCLPGYEDIYRSTSIACSKKATSTKLVTPPPTSLQISNHSVVTAMPQSEQRTHRTVQLLLPMIFAVLFCIFAVIAYVVYNTVFRKKTRRDSIEQGKCDHGQSSSTISTRESDESALLMDGLEDKEGERVRAELAPVSLQKSSVGGRPVDNQNNGQFSFINFEKKCSCCQHDCGISCQRTDIDSSILSKDSELLKELACSICHDPTMFFRYLDIQDSEVYGLDDDRQRSPHKISQREFIHSVLKRWTELKTTDATIGKMRQALCNAGFHRINQNVLSGTMTKKKIIDGRPNPRNCSLNKAVVTRL